MHLNHINFARTTAPNYVSVSPVLSGMQPAKLQ